MDKDPSDKKNDEIKSDENNKITSRRDASLDSNTANNSRLISSSNLRGINIDLFKSLGESFEESLIKPIDSSRITHIENLENIKGKDGSDLKITRSVKDVVGVCPELGTDEAIGRQVRETREKKAKGIEAFTDVKSESILGKNGSKITRTCQTSRVKYTTGSRTPASSLLDESQVIEEEKSKENIPSFYPMPSISNAACNLSKFTSNVLTTTSFYPLHADASSATGGMHSISFLPKTGQKYLSDERFANPGIMSTIRSTPTAKEIIPPTFTNEIENATVKKGGTAYFKGTVNGSFPFDAAWYFDNSEIIPNEHIETSLIRDTTESFITGLIDYIVALKIKNCTYKDIGKYTAYVRNEAGDASCSAFLIIEGNIVFKPKLEYMKKITFFFI